MGIFDRLFGRTEAPIDDPDRLREALFQAAAAGDDRRVERLARANQSAILTHFLAWRQVPESIRANPQAVNWYGHGLVTVAQCLAERLGRPEMLNALMNPGDNPLARWQTALGRARELLNDLRYDEARQLLTDALIESRGLTGSGLDVLLPVTHGFLAEAFFHSGRAAEAVPHLEHALTACERTGDQAGITSYLEGLFEAHRYLGRTVEAAGFADRLSEALGGAVGTRWRTRARIVRAGEPLVRVVASVNGSQFEIDEYRQTGDCTVQFLFERNRVTLQPATVRTEEGMRHGSEGRHEEALAAFREAAAADPFDPHSRFQEAFTLVHLERYAEALERYDEVEELAPGWFHSRADRWVAEQLLAGRLDHADFLGLHVLVDAPQPPADKLKLVDQMLARRPGFPALHHERGRALIELGRDADARAAFRAGLAADPDVDVRTRLLVELGVRAADAAEKAALLREALLLNGNLTAAATAAMMLPSPETRP